MEYLGHYSSPVGGITVASDGCSLTGLWFDGQKYFCDTLDAEHATLRNDETGIAQTITQREAQILQLLAENKNNVVRREAILSRFWNTEDDYFASRSLDVFVNKLRKLLADEPKITLKTIRGVGLQLLVS